MRASERRHRALADRVHAAAARCRNLSREYRAERDALEARREEPARAQHPKSCFLSDADIPNVGEGRKQALAACNILTDYDVDPGA